MSRDRRIEPPCALGATHGQVQTRSDGGDTSGPPMSDTEASEQIAELRRDLEQAEARAEAVHHVIKTVAGSTFDLDSVLQTVIDHAVLLCHADSGNIARRVGDVYRMAAFTSFGPEY